jgi:hypothetical protein
VTAREGGPRAAFLRSRGASRNPALSAALPLGFFRETKPCPAYGKQGFVAENPGSLRGTNVLDCELAVFVRGAEIKRPAVLADDRHADFHAFVADIDMGTGDELADVVLAFSTEGTIEGGFRTTIGDTAHRHFHAIRRAPGPTRDMDRSYGFREVNEFRNPSNLQNSGFCPEPDIAEMLSSDKGSSGKRPAAHSFRAGSIENLRRRSWLA